MKRSVSIAGWFLVSLITLTLAIQGEARAASWFDPAWSLRSSVTVSNPGATTLTNFQVHIILDSSFNFAGAKSNGSDVRITAADGVTQLPFWIESWNAGATTASIWVNVPSIPAGGATLYLYYGNASAGTASNGDSTFDFFDDFEIKTTGTNTLSGYFNLGAPDTDVLPQTQGWELYPTPGGALKGGEPHTLSVVQGDGSPWAYWGYYGLNYGTGGVGLAYSNDLVNWTKYGSNPLFLNGRWPSVVKVGTTFYMLTITDYGSTGDHIDLHSSSDGITFNFVKTIVAAESGLYNQDPNLFLNPNDGKYYIYWYRGNNSTNWVIYARSAATPDGLDDPASQVEVIPLSHSVMAAPNMVYINGTYFLTVAGKRSGLWYTLVFASTSPTSGFSLLPGNPVEADGSACNFQHVFGSTLHNYYCKLTGTDTWTLEHRAANLTRTQIVQHDVDPGKWLPTGGNWGIVQDTQPDGTVGGVGQGILSSTDITQVLKATTAFPGHNYVFEAHGKQQLGWVWGLGVRVTDENNLDAINLYNELDATNNLYVYDITASTYTPLTYTSVGTVDTDTWYKLTVKEHNSLLDVYKDDALLISSAAPTPHGDSLGLFGEKETVVEFDNVLVRKYAAIEPSSTVTADIILPVVSAFTVSTPSTSRNIPITSFTATDAGGSGIAGYKVTTTSTKPTSGAAGWTGTAPTIYTVASDGTYTLYPWVKDNSNNVSSVFGSPQTVVVDTVAPNVTAFTITSPSTSRNIPITSFTATDTGGSGIASYMVTTSSTQPTSGAAGWTGTAPTIFTVASDGTFTLYPWAQDNAGHVSSVFGTPRTVVVDTVVPTVTAFTATSPSTSWNIPITSFTASDAGGSGIASYMVTTTSTQPTSGAAGWTGTAPTIYTVASDGTFTLYPWAKDNSGNVSSVFGSPRTVVVDTVPPDTSITSQPTNPSNQTSASFSFTATEAGSTFACQIDSGGYSSCTTPKTYSSLASGTHTFTVRATDLAGNTDITPATYSWLIDTTLPNPPNVSGTTPTNNTTPTWIWTSGGGGGNGTYRYKLDSSDLTTGATTTTGTSYTAPTQADGTHTLYVQERNTAGSWSASGSFAIVIDTKAPDTSITSQQSNPSNQTSASFSFTATEPGSTFECQIDNGGYSSCTSPKSYSSLASGVTHTFTVRATDLAGNTDLTPATYSWLIDTTVPTVSISAPSSAVGNSGTPVTYTVTYSGADTVTLAAGNVTLNTTGNASGTIAVTGSGASTRTVTISNITGNGTIGISLAAGTASNLAGNATAAAGPSTTFTVDNSSGDFDGNGVDMVDALKALNFAAGLETPTALDIAHGDVAPLVNGIPHPDGTIDLADVVAILRKAVGLPSW